MPLKKCHMSEQDPIHIDYNLDPDLDPSWKNQIQVINISSRFTFFVQLKTAKVFATNSNILIPISLQPDGINL